MNHGSLQLGGDLPVCHYSNISNISILNIYRPRAFLARCADSPVAVRGTTWAEPATTNSASGLKETAGGYFFGYEAEIQCVRDRNIAAGDASGVMVVDRASASGV